MDENDISDILTSDRINDEWMSELNERVNQSYIAGTNEYIWYVTAIHNVFYALNVTMK